MKLGRKREKLMWTNIQVNIINVKLVIIHFSFNNKTKKKTKKKMKRRKVNIKK